MAVKAKPDRRSESLAVEDVSSTPATSSAAPRTTAGPGEDAVPTPWIGTPLPGQAAGGYRPSGEVAAAESVPETEAP